jgi:hypothetical protein
VAGSRQQATQHPAPKEERVGEGQKGNRRMKEMRNIERRLHGEPERRQGWEEEGLMAYRAVYQVSQGNTDRASPTDR